MRAARCAQSPGLAPDAVTGLPGRHEFILEMERLGASQHDVALLTLDLDRFTALNEHFGLACGDQLLRQVARRCLNFALDLPGRTVVGRVGADEFALAWLPAHADALNKLADQAERLHTTVAGGYELGLGRPVSVDLQVGVATMQAHAASAAETLLHAATARREACTGRGHVHRYEEQAMERRLGRRLVSLLHERRIGLALQPKVDLRSGQISGFEALARWPEGEEHAVPPSVFIPAAERMGLIAELGDCVLECALAWRRDVGLNVPVAVNFSAQQFSCKHLADTVLAALQRHELPAGALEIELTESVLLDDVDAAVVTLERLRELGLKLAIDDFGTGYSSLSYLCRFSVDRLKLDRSFVAQLCSDARTRSLVRAVITVAHELGLQCIAEGIETLDQLALLVEMGCDEGQGYLFSRPLPLQAAKTLALSTPPWQALLAKLPTPTDVRQ